MAEALPADDMQSLPGAANGWSPAHTSVESDFFSPSSEQVAAGRERAAPQGKVLGEGFCFGTTIGMCAGALLAIKAAMNTYLVIPAFGLVIPGPLGAAFAGALAGAAVGAVIGLLADRSAE